MARRYHSRLAKTEERKAKRSAVTYTVLTLLLVGFIFFFGFPFVSRFAGFIADLRGGSAPIEIGDNTPPAPPRLDNPPEYTNKTRLNVSGTTEPGVVVTIHFNKKQKEVVTGADGEFTSSFGLNDGANTLFAIAEDNSGNKSSESKHYSVTFDNESPEIEITKPVDGQAFYGSEKQISIEGITEAGSKVRVNGRVVIVGSDGRYALPYSLEDGENPLTVKSTDRAGNETEMTLTVSYSP